MASTDTRSLPHLRWVLFTWLAPPPGTPPAEIAAAVQDALVPLIERLEGAASARVALHIGGAVIDVVEREARELIPRLQALVAGKRLELIASTFYGAPLAGIPEPDAVAQLQLSVDWLRARIDAQIRGAWLPDEGWDPVVPRLLSRASLSYTFADRRLLPWSESGWAAVERDGHTVGVIPVDQALSEVVGQGVKVGLHAELRRHHGLQQGLACAAVPLRRPAHQGAPIGWLGPALDLMREDVAWLKASLPSMVLASGPGGHRAAPMAGLRPEVGSEALPAGTADLPTGVPWSRFLVRSGDANRLHKRMLRVSRQVRRMRAASQKSRRRHLAERQVQEASLDLYQAQSAALFVPSPRGGQELAPLRHHAWSALDRAEERARGVLGLPPSPHTRDQDGDGVPEVYIANAAMDAVICPAQGGALVELSLPGVGNILNTHQRQRPPWFSSVDREARLPQLVGGPQLVAVQADEVEIEESTGIFHRPLPATDEITETPQADPSAVSIPPELDDLLVDDAWPRAAFQERFPGPELQTGNIARAQAPEQGDFVGSRYQLVRVDDSDDGEQVVVLTRDGKVQTSEGPRMVRITKRISFPQDRAGLSVHYDVINRYSDPVVTRFGVELNLNLDGGVGEGRGLVVQVVDPTQPDGVRSRSISLQAEATVKDVVELGWCLDDYGRRVWLAMPIPAELYIVPIDTVCWSPGGLVRASQGHCLLFVWDLELWGDERKRFDLSLRVEVGAGARAGSV